MSNNPLELRELANDWIKLSLIKCCYLIKDGTHGTHKRLTIGIPLLSAKNITENGDVFWDESESCISEIEYQSIHKNYQIENDDLLLTIVGTLGRRALVKNNLIFTVQRSVAILRCDTNILIPKYFYHFSGSDYFQRQLVIRSNSTAQAGLYLGELEKIEVAIPPLPEQQKIAKILDTVEKAIALTQTHINKLKLAKAGLLHDLLTKGIDEHGELRNPKRNPEQFKDSPLGKIPKDWEITTLGNMLERSGGFIQTGPFGSQLHAHEYVNSGVPVIMPQDIINGLISTKQIEYISSKKARSLKRHIVQINDIIFARRGDLNRCVAIGERESNWFCGTGCMLARIPKQEINGYWLAEIYRHGYSQKQIQSKAVGSTMVNLNSTLLNSLIIAKPSIEEQTAICKEIAIQQQQILIKQTRLEKLKLLKLGLMSDLLTGKVRVKI